MKALFNIKNIVIFLLLAGSIQTSIGQTAKKLDSLFGTLYKRGDLNGCVLVAEGGKPIYEKAFGYADFDTKRLLNNQTMFELESVSKQFTAMAIMQLHQKGKLRYNDSLSKFFPQLPYRGITVDNLLHHTSGIPDVFIARGKGFIDENRINYNKDVLVALEKNAMKVYFKPGDDMSYSNTNYILLALIVEQVSGMSFSDYMDKYIFHPLGMKHTRVYAQRAAKKKITDYAYGYLYNAGRKKFVINDSVPDAHYEYTFDGVAGPCGISSNTEDMLKWDQALNTEKLVSKAEQALAYVPSKLNNGKIASLMGLPYGFGWLMLPDTLNRGRTYMHTGGGPGYMTIICRYPDKNKTFIILTNIYETLNLYELSGTVENILFNEPFTIPKQFPVQKTVTLTPDQLKAVDGSYILAGVFIKVIITTEANQVYAQITGQPKQAIYPETELDFFLRRY